MTATLFLVNYFYWQSSYAVNQYSAIYYWRIISDRKISLRYNADKGLITATHHIE
jgi:hypothetical protein